MDAREFVHVIETALEAKRDSFRTTDHLNQLEGWDSMGILSVITALERRFGVFVDVDVFETAETLSDLADEVAKCIAAKKAA